MSRLHDDYHVLRGIRKVRLHKADAQDLSNKPKFARVKSKTELNREHKPECSIKYKAKMSYSEFKQSQQLRTNKGVQIIDTGEYE